MIEFLKKYPALIFLGVIVLIALVYQLALRPSFHQQTHSPLLTYVDPEYHFSFQYSKEFKIRTETASNVTKVVLAEEPEGKNSFQININPFDDSRPLDQNRILHDLPDIVIEDIRTFRTGKNEDIPALNFFSKDTAVGDIFTVWFAHDHRLYQVSALRKAQVNLLATLKTFSF